MKTKQMALKVYPHTFTGDSFARLQNKLTEGWVVKQAILSFEGKDGSKIYDYILEKNTDNFTSTPPLTNKV